MKHKALIPLLLWGVVLTGYGADRLGLMPVAWRSPSRVSGLPSVWKLDNVKRVDGDTVRLSDGRKIRLVGIDTPEWDERGGPEAKAFLDQWLAMGEVTATVCPENSTDKYGRILGRLYAQGHDYQEAALVAGRARSLTIAPCGLRSAKYYTGLFLASIHKRRGTWRDSKTIDACEAAAWDHRVVEVKGRLRAVRKTARKLEIRLSGLRDKKLRKTCLRAVVLARNLPLWCPGFWCQKRDKTGEIVTLAGKITRFKKRMNLVLGYPDEITITSH